MLVYNFKITIQLIEPIPKTPPQKSDWYSFLANIYGTATKGYDGYVSTVECSDDILTVFCCLVEDIDNYKKLEPLKEKYRDWSGYQKITILDALKIHLRLLSYNASSITIISMPSSSSRTPE